MAGGSGGGGVTDYALWKISSSELSSNITFSKSTSLMINVNH